MSDSLNPPRYSPLGPVGSTVAIPQQVTDPTILDSVAGFINEVVPTASNGHSESKFQILWVQFEEVDSNGDHSYGGDNEKPPPIVLSLGYTTGVQVWAIAANGEGREILAWRHGSVKVLKILPKPCKIGKKVESDPFESKRPLIAICDSSSSNPQFSSISISSLKTGEQVKVIKFKNTILDIQVNKAAVVVTFQEKIAVFDAFTFEDRLTVTTCYLSPGVQPNPIALGARWLAFADKKLSPTRKSCGGNEGEGVQSYTATVLHAAKSLKKGLRELGESVASSLTGTATFKPGTSPNSPQSGGISDVPQKGIITILDIENPAATTLEKYPDPDIPDPIVAHFVAHTEAIVFLQFDPSGMLLFTADKRGHDFHIFRINPHAMGSLMAAVHHLYVLHRGDTTARVQDMCFSPDSRWAAVSTLRGTTHVFPISPYGGNVGVRTHATPHVVNKMSRFHRSAGLTADGRSNSPVSMFENSVNSHSLFENNWYVSRHPVVINPLAQLRQPVYIQNVGGTPQRQPGGRQRLSSSSEEVSLRLVTCFGPPRTWRLSTCSMFSRPKPAAVESLYTISSNGVLVQYDLDPHQSSNVPKEKVCNDTPIELTVNAKAQWMLVRQSTSEDIMPPMSSDNLKTIEAPEHKESKPDDNDDHWLSEVEILTHAGPHRRLWMGPQFTFKTYTTTSGSLAEAQPLDLSQTKPVNMPISKSNAILIESGSASSCEQYLLDEMYHKNCDEMNTGMGELRLREDLADAMQESPGIRETGGRCVIVQMKPAVTKVVNPLGTVVNVHSDDDNEVESFEEDVIHENCDEALFRPFVASKTLAYQNKIKRYGDDIITRSLEGTTEVAVKVLKKTSEKKIKSRENSPAKTKKMTDIENSSKHSKVGNKTGLTKKNGSVNDLKQIDMSTTSSKIFKKKHAIEVDPVHHIDTTFTETKHIVLDLPPPLDNEDFFSLENVSKIENFEDAVDCEDTSIMISKKDKQISSLREKICCEEKEKMTEEKSVTKKIRKPKIKLGVKIANINNENLNTEKTFEDCSAEISLPSIPKKTWSSVAASKSNEKSLIDSNEKENIRDLHPIEFVEEFTITLPRKPGVATAELIDINTPQEERAVKDETEKELLSTSDDVNLLKIDKSSDDEKGESSSSQAEVTESDDSGKVQDAPASEDMTQSKTITVSKSSRKKKKKNYLKFLN